METFTDLRVAAHKAIDILSKSPEFEGRDAALELIASIKEFRLDPVAARNSRALLVAERQSMENYVVERVHATGLKRRCYFRGRRPLIELANVDPKYFRKQSLVMSLGARTKVEGILLSIFDFNTYNRLTVHDDDYELKDENNQALTSFVEIEPMLDFMLAGPWIVG